MSERYEAASRWPASHGPDPLVDLEAELWSADSRDSGAAVPEEFDEFAYLIAFPDIAKAIEAGEFASARAHYMQHGVRESRLNLPAYRVAASREQEFPAAGIDAGFASPSGDCLVIGWIDDQAVPLVSVGLNARYGAVSSSAQIARCRREDAEKAVGAATGHLLGFWSIARIPLDAARDIKSVTLTVGRQPRDFPIQVQPVSDDRIVELAFEYLAGAQYYGNPHYAGLIQLAGGMGRRLVSLNAARTSAITAAPYVERFGPDRARFDASLIVCLYGRAEYLFLQSALFSQSADALSCEWVFVSNSPELAERLLREARMATRIYGFAITIVVLPGNAGFGAANNVGAAAARSDRIVIINPDVFPRAPGWATAHHDAIANLPTEQTRLFGAPLYYDDGSLMHAGMYFQIDEGLIIAGRTIRAQPAVRVEHYGKGAPPDTAGFLAARPVPAITGAFMSIDRAWYESLGGFSVDYVFGHYEDADLCLRSYVRGQRVWMHDIPFWHLEGKGSTRRPVHEGGSLVNRWLFTETWSSLVRAELLGLDPPGLTESRVRATPRLVRATA